VLRIVIDTNVAVSGLLWHGPSRQVLNAARERRVTIYTSRPLLDELRDVLDRPKIAPRLALVASTSEALLASYLGLATLVRPMDIDPVVIEDPDDDCVLACALAAQANVIVSGDKDLLRLGGCQGVAILTAADFLARLSR